MCMNVPCFIAVAATAAISTAFTQSNAINGEHNIGLYFYRFAALCMFVS